MEVLKNFVMHNNNKIIYVYPIFDNESFTIILKISSFLLLYFLSHLCHSSRGLNNVELSTHQSIGQGLAAYSAKLLMACEKPR